MQLISKYNGKTLKDLERSIMKTPHSEAPSRKLYHYKGSISYFKD